MAIRLMLADDHRMLREGLRRSLTDEGFDAGIWWAPFLASSTSRVAAEHPDWLMRDRRGRPIPGLPNPRWEPHLRAFSGGDALVVEYLSPDAMVAEMEASIASFLETWIPRFQAESRPYLTVALGCTGGQHRSVYMAEKLADRFRQDARWSVILRHRELA